MNDHKEVVEILLQNGADPNIRNKDNKTASEIAKNKEISLLIGNNIFFNLFIINITKWKNEVKCSFFKNNIWSLWNLKWLIYCDINLTILYWFKLLRFLEILWKTFRY